MALHVKAGGIEFTPQGGSSVNLLNDYEQGLFSPVLSADNSRPGTWSSIAGKYIIIGRQLSEWMKIAGSGMYFSSERGYQYITSMTITVDTTTTPLYSGLWNGDAVAAGSGGHLWRMSTNSYMHCAGGNPATGGVDGIGIHVISNI